MRRRVNRRAEGGGRGRLWILSARELYGSREVVRVDRDCLKAFQGGDRQSLGGIVDQGRRGRWSGGTGRRDGGGRG